VIARLIEKTFQACVCGWKRSVADVANRELVRVDGKTALGPRDRHSVSGACSSTPSLPSAIALLMKSVLTGVWRTASTGA